MRKLTYYVACTVDGFIAREDGSFDFFLPDGEHFAYLLSEFPETVPSHLRDKLGVRGANRNFDTVLMGRRTYEVGSVHGITSPYPQMRQVVISRSLTARPDPAVDLVREDAVGAVRRLKEEDGLDIWLCGGADLAAALYEEIDELMLKVNPISLGAGLPLFGREVGPTRLDLIDTKAFNNGFVMNRYRMLR
jgi:dihydrofolate reductase